MTSDKFMNYINNIDEEYITEYLIMPSSKSMVPKKYIWKWVMAASVILIIGIITVPHLFSPPRTADLKVKAEIFPSYNEFISTLPKDSLLKNITVGENTTLKYMGEYKDLNSDEFASFSITFMEQEDVFAYIQYVLSPTETAAEYASRHVLNNSKTIGETTIYYAYKHEEYYEAVFMHGTSFYDVQCHVNDEKQLMELITDMFD